MGIRFLNRFLQDNCKKSIKKIDLHDLSGKKIIIDTSIYLYRFLGENALLENFYHMITIFRKYNITPLFVFDGKPPKEKFELIKERSQLKKQAKREFNELKEKIKNCDENEKKSIINEMEQLKKEFICLHHTDIENVKKLITSYGVSYIEAIGEADKLCAKIVCQNKAYACLSEDMDLFVYGCNKVLRYFSLIHENCVLYDYDSIINELNMNENEFKHICILSGTDYKTYSNNNNNNNIYQIMKYFNHFKLKNNQDNQNNQDNFIIWFQNNNNLNIEEFNNTKSLFDLENMPDYDYFKKIDIYNSKPNISNLKKILETENFLFV